MYYRGPFMFRFLGALLVLALIFGGGSLLYRAGFSQGLAQGMAQGVLLGDGKAGSVAPGLPYAGSPFYPGYGGFGGPHVGFFGFFPLACLFGLFLIFGLGFFFRARHGGWHPGGPWGSGQQPGQPGEANPDEPAGPQNAAWWGGPAGQPWGGPWRHHHHPQPGQQPPQTPPAPPPPAEGQAL